MILLNKVKVLSKEGSLRHKEIQSFSIYKITTDDIIESITESGEYELNFSYSKAVRLGKVVSLGDNQVLMKIREKTNHPYNSRALDRLYKEREEIQALSNSEENTRELKAINAKIFEQLFIPELITVHCKNKKDYKELTRKTFKLNGRTFVRFASGSGQTRRNSPAFIDKAIYDEIHTELLCGLGDRIKKINVAKFNAYYGLYMSAINEVPFPRFCVVPDNYITLKNEKVYWIDSVGDKHSVDVRNIDAEMNTHDGMGLCTPEYNEQLKNHLGLDWDVNNWGIRGPYTKGLLVPFDILRFANEVAGTYIIKDLWGDDIDVRDIDVILTKSQFKMWKYYKNQKDLEEQIQKNKLVFGVCRYNKRVDNEYSLLNYQYIQTLELNREKISQLIKPTIDNIHKVCSGDKLYALWFMLGAKSELADMKDIINSVNTNFVKALLYNDDVFKDPYIKKKIYKLIEKQIQLAKLGRVYARGNYQTMIADPYALAEHIFGLKVTGILERGQIYSKWWSDRGVNRVDACRSPMVAQEEHNIVSIVQPEKALDWYRYINSGIIYNIWDASTIIHSDSDFDFDIVFTTDDKIILDNVVENVLPITYEKISVPDQKFNYSQFIKADLQGFNTKIGSITNNSSIMFAMLPMFKGDKERESILKERIHVLRKLIGNSIDAAKGVKYIPFPTEWKKRQVVLETDTEEEKTRKRRHNSLVVSKKPYFMIEIYPELKERYKTYRKNYDLLSMINFGCSIKQLIEKKNKSDEEIRFLSRYNYYSPVLNTSCIMNMLCKEVEDTDFNFKYYKQKEEFDYNIYLSKEPISEGIEEQVFALLKEMKKDYNKLLNVYREESHTVKEIGFSLKSGIGLLFDEYERKILSIVNNRRYMVNYLIKVSYEKNDTVLKNFVWTNFGKEIVKNLGKNKDYIEVPVVSDLSNGVNIFGNNVKLSTVFDNKLIDEITNQEHGYYLEEMELDLLGDLE